MSTAAIVLLMTVIFASLVALRVTDASNDRTKPRPDVYAVPNPAPHDNEQSRRVALTDHHVRGSW